MKDIINLQKQVCQKYNLDYLSAGEEMMVGVSEDFLKKKIPINGLRHKPENNGSGWFLWSGGEISEDPSFFKPIHIKHLIEEFPEIVKYLGLPSGSRIQIDLKGYEDIWFDEKLND
jgi:hypothetical protein